MSGTVRGYFQYRGSDDEERQFVESPDGHYVVTAEQRARWDRTLSAMAQMQAEIDVLCKEQGEPPLRPSQAGAAMRARVMEEAFRPHILASLRTPLPLGQVADPPEGATARA